MEALAKLSSVMGLSMTSGINLYATVAVVGLVTKFNMIKGLPPEFEAFDNDLIILLAVALYLCEFAADKIPGFDSLWDSIHTIIRPFGAALVSMAAVGQANPSVEVLAGLLGATLALGTHTAKAGTRLIINTSPEPFSNVIVSLAEDIGVVGFVLLVMAHPYISLLVSLVLLILLVRFGPGLWRGALLILKAIPIKLFALFQPGGEHELKEPLPDNLDEVVDEQMSKSEQVKASLKSHARNVKGCGRNRKGYLILTDRQALFAFRRLFKSRIRQWSLSDLEKAKLQRRFLVDVLSVKSEGKFLRFLFLKNRSGAARQFMELLDASIGPSEARETVPGASEPVTE